MSRSPCGPADLLVLGGESAAEGIGTCDLRGALLVEVVDFLDREARSPQQVDNWPGEVASAGDPFLHRVEASLPAAYPFIGGQPVLQKMQGPPRLEDSPQLAQGGGVVGDGAQRPGGQPHRWRRPGPVATAWPDPGSLP